MVTGIRKVTGLHADQVLRVPAGGTGVFHDDPIRAAHRRRGVRRPHGDLVAVHPGGRRDAVQQLVSVASREPDADRPSPVHAEDGARAHTGGGRRQRASQRDEHVLQFAVERRRRRRRRRGRGQVEQRPVRPPGGVARGQVVRHVGRGCQLHGIRVRRRGRRKRPDNRLIGELSTPRVPLSFKTPVAREE